LLRVMLRVFLLMLLAVAGSTQANALVERDQLGWTEYRNDRFGFVMKRYTTEQIIGLLREAEVRLGQGQAIGTICRGFGISEQSYYRWRREYGGLKLDQAKRLKDLERENDRLKKAVSELTLDKLILKEALGGKY
jgi:putative transposase